MSALLDNFWILLVLKVALIAAVVPGVALVFIFAELKISAHMQSRIGPYFAGGRFGWARFLDKEAGRENCNDADQRDANDHIDC